MTVRVGVLGIGAMGASHARMLATEVPGARVGALYEPVASRAVEVGAELGARVAPDPLTLVTDDEIDAVVIATPDHTHADLVLACLEAGKPVLCEKPLAVGLAESQRVLAAEQALGRRLVQVGFMRRYDPGYVALRAALRDGEVGAARLVHCVHRNAQSHPSATSESIVTGSMVHELDLVRWLLDDDVATVSVRSPRRAGDSDGGDLADPQLSVLEMASGVLVSVDVFVNAGYGYDVRCEVVGESGTLSLAPPVRISSRRAGLDGVGLPSDFVVRFDEAYRLELTDWVDSVRAGEARGPSAWDGHLAQVASAAGVRSLQSDIRVSVDVPDRPALYA